MLPQFCGALHNCTTTRVKSSSRGETPPQPRTLQRNAGTAGGRSATNCTAQCPPRAVDAGDRRIERLEDRGVDGVLAAPQSRGVPKRKALGDHDGRPKERRGLAEWDQLACGAVSACRRARRPGRL